MKGMHMVAFVLLVVGGINWGLVGLGGFMGQDWNVVKMVLGQWSALENFVYVLVGASAVMLASSHKKDCRHCEQSGGGTGM